MKATPQIRAVERLAVRPSKRKIRQQAIKLALTLLFVVLAIIMILPYLWMLSAAFKPARDLFKYPVEWLPQNWSFDNFSKVWTGKNSFANYYLNSFKITGLTMLGSLTTSSLAGFAFAKINFKGRNVLFLLYLATTIIPAQVLLVPRFIVFDWLGLINNHLSIILPGSFTVFGTFLMRQFFSTIPNELIEAARVDGAGYWRIFWQICLPLTKPALVSLAILTFTWHWNEYENPLIFLRDKNLFTIPLGLTNYSDEFGTDYSLLITASVSALVPLIVLVLVCQRWFVEGIASTGIKG